MNCVECMKRVCDVGGRHRLRSREMGSGNVVNGEEWDSII